MYLLTDVFRGFQDLCKEKQLKHQIFIREMGHTYESTYKVILPLVEEMEKNFHGMKKGIFISNDTHANLLLNILIRKYGKFPDDYLIIGFDNSPISREAIIPISTIGQQIDTIAYEAVSLLVEQMNERKKRRPNIPDQPIHKIITPILLRRETTEGFLSFGNV